MKEIFMNQTVYRYETFVASHQTVKKLKCVLCSYPITLHRGLYIHNKKVLLWLFFCCFHALMMFICPISFIFSFFLVFILHLLPSMRLIYLQDPLLPG